MADEKKEKQDNPGNEAGEAVEQTVDNAKKATEAAASAASKAAIRTLTGGASAAAAPLEDMAANAMGKIIAIIIFVIIGIAIFFLLMVASLFNVVLYELGFDNAKEYAEASYEADTDQIEERLIEAFGGDDDDTAKARTKVDDAFEDHVLGRVYDEIEEDYVSYAESLGLETDPDAEGYIGYTVVSEYDTFWDGEYIEFFQSAILELATDDELKNIQNGTGMWSADDPSLEYFVDSLLTNTQYNNETHRWADWERDDPTGGETSEGSRVYFRYMGSSAGSLVRGKKYYADEIEGGSISSSVSRDVKESYEKNPELWEVGTETANGDIYEPSANISSAGFSSLWDASVNYMNGKITAMTNASTLTNTVDTDGPVTYHIYLQGYASHSLDISDDAEFETVEDDDSMDRATGLLQFVTGEDVDGNGDLFGLFDEDNVIGKILNPIIKVFNNLANRAEGFARMVGLGSLSREEIRSGIGTHEMNQLSEYVSWKNIDGVSENGYLSSNGMWDTSLGSRAAEAALNYKDFKYSQEKRTSDGYVDCSSLCFRAYRDAGFANLWGMTAASEAKYCVENGMEITNPTDLRAGDLIFSTSGSNGRYKNITHVGMYIGDYKGDGKNYVINAASSKSNVVIQEFNAYIGCRTIVMYGRPYVAMLNIESVDDIHDFLIGCGFTEAGAAGILGNMQVETIGTFDSTIESPSGYYGLIQWDKTSRKEKLKNYCSKNGLDYTSATGQMNYLIYEMQSTTSYKKAYDYLRDPEHTDPQQCAQEFCVGLEGCVGKTGSGDAKYTGTLYSGSTGRYYQALGKRESWAQTYYDKYTK